MEKWLSKQSEQGYLPDELFLRAEQYLLNVKVILPGPSVMERLIISTCSNVHERLFESLYQQLWAAIAKAIANNLSSILADEPTGALDQENRQLILNLFHELNRNINTTIIIVTYSSLVASQRRIHKNRSESDY